MRESIQTAKLYFEYAIVCCASGIILTVVPAEALGVIFNQNFSIGYYAYVLLFLVGFFAAVRINKTWLFHVDKHDDKEVNEAVFYEWLATIIYFPAYLIFSSALFRHLYIEFGGFVAPSTDFWHWLPYCASLFLDDVSLGVTNTFNWHISDIYPIATWAKDVVFIFNIILQITIITTIVQLSNLIWARRAGVQDILK